MPEPDRPLSERPWEDVARLLSVDDALARILADITPLEAVDMPLLRARGMTLAESVCAPCDVPPFRNSAMDGYAVRAADTIDASDERPTVLRVTAVAPAGSGETQTVGAGEAIRIMTGAMMPVGADAVVRFEETDDSVASPDSVRVFHSAALGDNVRQAGEDVSFGSAVFAAGRTLAPPDLGLLAALGATTARVHRQPRVAVLSTGDEVEQPGTPPRPGAIYDSNATTLAAMAEGWGAEVTSLGIARDRLRDVAEHLKRAAASDLIVTSGGVSLGDYDFVKDALRAAGEVAIWQVRMKPGKPLAFGRIGGVPLLGLPGNPVAAAVSFEVFGRPAIRKMLGRRDLTPATVEVVLGERLENQGMRRHYVRAWIERDMAGEWSARPVGSQGAGMLTSLVLANALLIVPETVERAEPGDRLRAMPLGAR
ncbi:MAG: molybdopterin molybdotransferase MoeA [Thermomicrobiales bacterium]|nr:molybdopterin molybdotransferase MoeA [Thermomicrobiales bacterium]